MMEEMDAPIEPEKKEEERQIERIIAQAICKENRIATLRENKEFCLYRNGVFISGNDAETRIHAFITDLAGILVLYDSKGIKKHYALTISRQNMILEFIRNLTYCSMTEFDIEPTVINVLNGLYYLNGTEGMVRNPGYDPSIKFDSEFPHNNPEWILGTVYFKEHPTPDFHGDIYKSFIQFPVTYDSEKECLKIDEFLSDVFGFEAVPLIYEMIGYFLYGTIEHQKAFIIHGPPATGKTTFIQLLMSFLEGKRYGTLISQLRLQSLSGKFQVIKTKGKILNIWDDLPKSKVGISDMFRLIVTNKVLSGRVKYVVDNVSWYNRCKLLFTCNTLPPVEKDMGTEFWRRWILESCFCEFKTKDKMTIEDESNPNVKVKKPRILDIICTSQEFSGLLNKALQAYKRLDERGGFPKEWDDVERLKGLWQIDINPVKLFLDECCEVVDGARTEYYAMNDAINEFRAQHGAKAITSTMVTQSLRKAYSKIERSKDRKHYLNIKIAHKVIDGELEEIEAEGIDRYLVEALDEKEDYRTVKEKEKILNDVDYSDPNRF